MAQKEIREIILTKPAEKIYDKSPEHIQQRLDRCFGELEENPFSGGNIKTLTGQLKGLHRFMIGDRRVIYRILKEKRLVEIIAILPRGDAYK